MEGTLEIKKIQQLFYFSEWYNISKNHCGMLEDLKTKYNTNFLTITINFTSITNTNYNQIITTYFNYNSHNL